MTLTFYNTLTRKKEVFKELHKGKILMYTCGPTIYNFAHIGNLRTFVFEDLLRRYLQYKGYVIRQVMNITDVDDKTIKGAQKEKIPLKTFTAQYGKAFYEDLKTLNIEPVEVYPAATAHIPEMVALIKRLMEKGVAYRANDGSIYFSIKKFKEYGKLAKIDLENLKAGARVSHDEYDKEQLSDFALWKAWDENDGTVFWETELGKGRPGWHIECSAMSMTYLGESFDIHAGGVDLIFPHHENEIAQSEAATGKQFVKYWLHAEHLIVNGKKMSKSAGNFYTLRDLLAQGHDPRALRYLLLATHYRQQLNFTLEGLEAAANAVERLDNFMASLENATGTTKTKSVTTLVNEVKPNFEEAMDDDLNISAALGHIFDFVREINAIKKLSTKDAGNIHKTMLRFDQVLGILYTDKKVVSGNVQQLVAQREKARKSNNWEEADALRKKILALGWLIEDTEQGPRLKKKK